MSIAKKSAGWSGLNNRECVVSPWFVLSFLSIPRFVLYSYEYLLVIFYYFSPVVSYLFAGICLCTWHVRKPIRPHLLMKAQSPVEEIEERRILTNHRNRRLTKKLPPSESPDHDTYNKRGRSKFKENFSHGCQQPRSLATNAQRTPAN